MSAKFTPGPWSVMNGTDVFGELGGDSGDGMNADSADGWQVADCNQGITFCEGIETELGYGVRQANARLIAAAPELYDAADMALNALIGCCVAGDGVDDRKTMLEAQTMLRAALKKATGE